MSYYVDQIKICTSKSSKSIHLTIIKPKVTNQKDRQLSKQFKDQLRLLSCNPKLGTCVPDILVPSGLDGLHTVLQRVKDESGIIVNLSIDKCIDTDAYDYSDTALDEAIKYNLYKVESFYFINNWVDYLAGAISSFFRFKNNRFVRLGHLGKWQVRVWVWAFALIYPSLGQSYIDMRNHGITLLDFLFFFGWAFDFKRSEMELHGSLATSDMACYFAEKKSSFNDDITIYWKEKSTIFKVGPGAEIRELFQTEYR